MVLVLLGTQQNEFIRLLQKIEELIDSEIIKDRVVVQAGYTKYQTNKMEIFDIISKEKLDKLVDDADIIITHGGIGSIIMSLEKHKKVIAVPRLHEFNEHVNDHQKQIVRVFSEKGYLIGIQNVDDLSEALEKIKIFEQKEYKKNNQNILNIIENFIDNI